MRNFQILIVSAVKICKQCLQTGGLRAQRASPLDSTPLDYTGGLSCPDSLGFTALGP